MSTPRTAKRVYVLLRVHTYCAMGAAKIDLCCERVWLGKEQMLLIWFDIIYKEVSMEANLKVNQPSAR